MGGQEGRGLRLGVRPDHPLERPGRRAGGILPIRVQKIGIGIRAKGTGRRRWRLETDHPSSLHPRRTGRHGYRSNLTPWASGSSVPQLIVLVWRRM